MKRQIALVVLVALGLAALGARAAAADEPPAAGAAPAVETGFSKTVGLGLAAAMVGSLGILGAGYAVARVGSAALGALAERPELFVRALIFVALAEGLAVLGFAIAILLYNKMG